jgi:hypothetical protein
LILLTSSFLGGRAIRPKLNLYSGMSPSCN